MIKVKMLTGHCRSCLMALHVWLAVLVAINPVLAEPEKKHVAITTIGVQDVDTSRAIIFTDRLSTELFKTQSFKVVERSQMKTILEEQDFQQTDCVAEECAVEIGQLLGVSHIITGAISKIGKTYSINLRLIDVATGEVVYTDNEDCKCKIDRVFTESTRAVAQKMSSYFTGNPPAAEVPQVSGKKSSKTWLWITGGVVVTGLAAGGYLFYNRQEEAPENINMETDVNIQ